MFAAFGPAVTRVEHEATFDLLGLMTVAFVAIVAKEFADVIVEQRQTARRSLISRGERKRWCERDKRQAAAERPPDPSQQNCYFARHAAIFAVLIRRVTHKNLKERLDLPKNG